MLKVSRVIQRTRNKISYAYVLLLIAIASIGLSGCAGLVSQANNANPGRVAPSISTQPASQTVTAGQAAIFNVAAAGTAPLSYQWKRNGTAISGANSSSYTTPATASSDNGAQFAVMVSNTVGSVPSSAATLTVNSSTTPPGVPSGLSASAASSTQINLTWTASTGSVTGYKIFRGGAQVGTSTSTTHQDNGLLPSTSYTYTVAAFAGSGNTSAQSAGASATTLASSGGGGIPNTLGWFQIPNTQLQSVCPSASQDPNIQGIQGCAAVMSTWSGGVADPKRNRLIIWGGGHNAYYGNEVYALNLTANPITLTRLNAPSSLPGNYTDCNTAYSDGKPASRHTYDGLVYDPDTDSMITYGGSRATCGSFLTGSGNSTDIWSLSMSSLAWTEKNDTAPVYSSYIPTASYDPNTNLIFFHDQQQLWTFKASTNAYTSASDQISVRNNLAYSSLVIDPVHKYAFIMGGSGGGGTGGQLYRYNISGTPPYPVTDLLASSTGCGAYLSTTSTNDAPGGPGVAWYPVQNKIVMWNGGNSVALYDPVANSCSTVTYPGGPSAQQTHGTYGRFSYFSQLGVFVLCNDIAQNCYTLRIDSTGGSGAAGPVISNVSAASITTLGATISWATDVGSTSQVEYGTTTGYGTSTTLGANLVTTHSAALTGLTTNTLYHYRVHSKNSGGTESISGDFAVQTSNTTDTTPPTVSITAPVANATVSSTVTVSANASDNVAVSSVQFQLDGINLGSALTSGPYSISWDTMTTSNAIHVLTAQASDAAGNVGTAVGVPVSVSNSTSSADQNFQQRCVAAGVLSCQGFDGAAVFSQQVDFINVTDGFNPPGNPNNIRDTSVFVSGGSSARFHIPANAGQNCCANWFAYFGQGANNQHFSENSTFYVQYAFRADATWVSHGWVSDSYPKLSIFHSLLPGSGGVPGSCADMELTVINIHTFDSPQMYSECGQRHLFTSSDGVNYDEGGAGPFGQQGWSVATPFTGYECAYNNGTWSGPNCFNFVANQWYTLYFKVHIGNWGSSNSSIEAWVAPYGQQLKKWINVFNYPLINDPPNNCNGLSPCPGFNVLELTQFMTAHSGSNPAADVWYDELIISTQPIPAPAGQTP